MRNRQVFRKTRTGYTFKYRRGEFIQIEPSVFVRGDGKLLDRVVAVRDLPWPQRERAEMDTIDQAMARRHDQIEKANSSVREVIPT